MRPDGRFEGHGGHRGQGNYRADGQGRRVDPPGAGSVRALKQDACPKGDVLATAKVAAIQAVKATSTIIPLCHPILVEGIDVGFSLDEASSVGVTIAVKSSGKTGVEMEALHGVAAACLTIYDMLKYTGKGMTIERIQLLEKTGGRSGDYKRHD